MTETMLLIPGRSTKQGTSLNKGKCKEEYLAITSTVEMNEDDMKRLDLNEGDKVRLCNHIGETIVGCKSRKVADLPPGLLFMAYGPGSSRLMGSDTAASGMPQSKHLEVEVEKVTG
ncbi:MAG: molybdopterin dinucleotide binding domain-containing protein [Gammaproteobacteria bacterium]